MLRLLALSFLAAAVAPRAADACDLPLGDLHMAEAGEAVADTIAPVIVGDSSYTVGEFEPIGCCNPSCADVDVLRLSLEVTDNRSDTDQIGFLFEVTSGSLPIELPDQAVTGDSINGDRVGFVFEWDAFDAVSATLQITPVDLGGNLGAPVTIDIDELAPIDDEFAHRPGLGAAIGKVTSRSPFQTLAFVALAMAIVFRPRRR